MTTSSFTRNYNQVKIIRLENFLIHYCSGTNEKFTFRHFPEVLARADLHSRVESVTTSMPGMKLQSKRIAKILMKAPSATKLFRQCTYIAIAKAVTAVHVWRTTSDDEYEEYSRFAQRQIIRGTAQELLFACLSSLTSDTKLPWPLDRAQVDRLMAEYSNKRVLEVFLTTTVEVSVCISR